MSNKRDGIDRLRKLNPINEADVEGPDSPRAQELLARITATPQLDTQVSRRKNKRLRLVLSIVAVVLVTTAATWLWTANIDKPNTVTCYQAVDLGADIAGAPSGGEATAEACAVVWQDRVLTNTDLVSEGEVPPLTACVAANGSLAVFPTADDSVCRTFNMASPDPAGQDAADHARAVGAELITYFQSEGCIPMADAAERVRQILDHSGLGGWTVESQPSNPERPCSSHSFDPVSETVQIVPIPAPPSN